MVEFNFDSSNEGDEKMSYFVTKFCHYFEIVGSLRLFPEQELLIKVWKHYYQLKEKGDVLKTVQSFEARFVADGVFYFTQESTYPKDEPMQVQEEDQIP